MLQLRRENPFQHKVQGSAGSPKECFEWTMISSTTQSKALFSRSDLMFGQKTLMSNCINLCFHLREYLRTTSSLDQKFYPVYHLDTKTVTLCQVDSSSDYYTMQVILVPRKVIDSKMKHHIFLVYHHKHQKVSLVIAYFVTLWEYIIFVIVVTKQHLYSRVKCLLYAVAK